MLKFLTKSSLFGYVCDRILRSYCDIWNQHPQICLFAKFWGKRKTHENRIKSAIFEYLCT